MSEHEYLDRHSLLRSGLVVGILVTPVAIYLSIAAEAYGDENGVVAALLFPHFALASAVFNGPQNLVAAFVGFLQFPLYGLAIGSAIDRHRGDRVAAAIAAIHLTAVLLHFAIGTREFQGI